MRLRIFSTILILFLALPGFVLNISAQEEAQKKKTASKTEPPPQPETALPAQTAAAPPAATPTPAAAEIMNENDRLPFMQEEQAAEPAETGSGGLLLKTLGSMFLIIGLLFFGAWGIKKYGLFGTKTPPAEDAPDLKIMSSVAVANGQTLSVVRFGERVLLVGSTPHSFTLLADEDGLEAAETEKKPKSVSDLLAEENASFGKELSSAQNRLNTGYQSGGGQI